MTHFYMSIPRHIEALSDRETVDAFVQRATVPGDAIRGMTDEQLNAFPIAGTWSIKQIVVHLMDTDLIACYRMKRIIAEDKPELDLYDETAFSHRLVYDRQDATRVCEVFRLNRLNMGDILRTLPNDAFRRVALHPEVGELPLGGLVRIYVNHVDHHLAFIKKKRAMLEQ
jgi:hypothetical protein